MPINKGKTAKCPKCGHEANAVFQLIENKKPRYGIYICPECAVRERIEFIHAYEQKMRRAKTEKGRKNVLTRFIAEGMARNFGEFPVCY